ncbi:MAG: 30S ribosomal protein S6 [Bacteroidetes bacterium]|nr:MAG: 30S ribosomal protein S6 [Bacteroidota bacterium]
MDIKPKKFKNEYETTFILNPDLPEDGRKKAVDKIVQLIKDNDGTVHNLEHWGMRRLAYPIAKRNSGYYVFIEFNAYSEFIKRLERDFRYDEDIIRYLTVKLDKHALAFNKKRREQGFGMRKELKQ